MKHIPIPSILCLLSSALFFSHAHGFNDEPESKMANTETFIEEQEVVIPLAEKITQTEAALPVRGQGKSKIKTLFGEPNKQHPAKGKPPIERWDYSEFSVYFESGVVIHTVIKHSPNH